MHGILRRLWRIPDSRSSAKSRYSDKLKQARKQTGPGLSAAPLARGKKTMHHLTARPDMAGEKNRPTLWENKDNQGFLSYASPPFPLVSSCSKPVKCFFFFFFLPTCLFFRCNRGVKINYNKKQTEPGMARYAFVFTDGRLVQLIIEKEVWDCAPFNRRRLCLCFPV